MSTFSFKRIFTILIILLIIAAGLTYAAVNIWPSIGATTVEALRGVFGDKVVAQVENSVLKTQDNVRQLVNKVVSSSPNVSWGAGNLQSPVDGKADWLPSTAIALEKKKNEAQWEPFISSNGRIVAYRTFIVPDPLRPYAFAAVIAFDLYNTRLHFLLGTQEPKSDVQVPRFGRIPTEDRKPGYLLAAFNGGFKAEHGHFGVKVDGVTVIPPRENIGTVGLYSDGTVRMGLLGKDVPETNQLITWRQNGPLVVQDGQINPLTNSTDPQDWGFVVGSDTATYRSALGISKDGRTLYFVIGPDLTLPALARALKAVQAYQAIQLDINNFWAHFESFEQVGAEFKAVPLLDFMKNVDDQRFLGSYLRDYFYVTTK